jgi:uncharacterized protein YprB with RNaseH-like and TPR domain
VTDSLSDRLKALGFIPAAKMEKPNKSHLLDFDTTLESNEVFNQLGTTHLVEKQYPLDYQHGMVNFQLTSQIGSLSTAARVQTTEGTDLSGLLFLDTETTGLSGGTGTLAFLVGLGYFTPSGFHLNQYILKEPDEEMAMLLEIINLCSRFSGIVTYNGKGFDIPLLRTRLVMNHLPNPFEQMAHFDLLHLARRIWKNRLQSRSLQDLEQEILNIPRSDGEVPGWMIPQIYFDYLRTGNSNPLKGVIYHNGMDILSLAALFLHLSSSFENIQEVNRFNPVDYFSLGQLYYDLGFTEIAERIFITCESQNQLPVHLKLIVFQRLGELNKVHQDYETALIFWQKATTFEDISSAVEIAKYYEHAVQDYPSALQWTETAITFLIKKGYHTYQSHVLEKELLKRKDRLAQKIERKNGYVSKKNR